MANLKTKESISQIQNLVIPEIREKYSDLANLKKVEINIDFDSFENNSTEVDYVGGQVSRAFDKVREMMSRSDVAKQEIEKQFKKITVGLVKDESQRVVKFNNGELTLLSTSIINSYLSSDEIENAFEEGL